MMDHVQDLDAWIEESDRQIKEWMDGLEEESHEILERLVAQTRIDGFEENIT